MFLVSESYQADYCDLYKLIPVVLLSCFSVNTVRLEKFIHSIQMSANDKKTCIPKPSALPFSPPYLQTITLHLHSARPPLMDSLHRPKPARRLANQKLPLSSFSPRIDIHRRGLSNKASPVRVSWNRQNVNNKSPPIELESRSMSRGHR